jgi:hypothetical protein
MTCPHPLRRAFLLIAAGLLAASIGTSPVYAANDKPADTTKSQKKAVKESKTKTKTTSEGTYGPPERGAPTGY